jgi:citrate synthase
MYNDVNIDCAINMTPRITAGTTATTPATVTGERGGDRSWTSAAEASRLLRVTRATLYAYVSRGYIRSESRPGSARERRYSRDDVERLRRRSEWRRHPDLAAASALHWGLPILESSITLIAGSTLYYRGYDAVELARSRPLAEVASLVWSGRFDTALPPPEVPRAAAARGAPPAPRAKRAPTDGDEDALTFVARAQSRLARAAAADSLAFDLRPESVTLTGWRILTLLTAIAARSDVLTPTLDRGLARAWGVSRRGADLLRAALILCADHELNVSSFTARSVASSGANPYAVVIAGLAAIEGTRHGGVSIRVESMMESMRRAPNVRSAIGERLRRGEPIDGFGHPLYRDGDPRAAALMTMLRDRYPRSPELAFAIDLAEAAASVMREHPTIDFALAALARVLRLPAGSPLTLFALGRTIGWIGHAIEQYRTGQIIRPRARYVGNAPVIAPRTPRIPRIPVTPRIRKVFERPLHTATTATHPYTGPPLCRREAPAADAGSPFLATSSMASANVSISSSVV